MAKVKLPEVTLILRNKTDKEWEESTEILQQGQLGLENNTGRAKMGDGKSLYRDLPYLYLTPDEVQKSLEELKDQIEVQSGVTSITVGEDKLEGDVVLGSLALQDLVGKDDLDVEMMATGGEAGEMLDEVFSGDHSPMATEAEVSEMLDDVFGGETNGV